MDCNYLMSDELDYELELRKINLNDPNRIEKLQRRFIEEQLSSTSPTLEVNRMTRSAIQQEIHTCNNKLTEISKAINEALQNGSDELFAKSYSRLLYVAGRVQRIQQCPDQVSAKRLMSRVYELTRQLKDARDSIGSGEDIDGSTVAAIEPATVDEEVGALTSAPVRESAEIHSRILTNMQSGVTFSQQTEGAQFMSAQSTAAAASVNTAYQTITTASSHGAIPKTSGNHSGSASSTSTGIQSHAAPHSSSAYQVWNSSPPTIPLGNYIPPHWSHHAPAVAPTVAPPLTHANQSAAPQLLANNNNNQQDIPRENVIAGGHRIHQWSLRFDGGPNGLEVNDFLFRVERQARLYGVNDEALAIGFGELLKGRAEQWFWTFQRQYEFATWEELKDAFIQRYAPNQETDFEIRSQIESRRQRPCESFNDFCQDVEAMATRLVRRMTDRELVQILRRNMLMHLRKALWQNNIVSVHQLLQCCAQYENLCKEEEWQTQQRRPARINEVTVDNNNQSRPLLHQPTPTMAAQRNSPICWNCNETGHTFVHCPQSRNGVFCFACGMRNVIKVSCPRCAENGIRNGTAAISRPLQPPSQPLLPTNPFRNWPA